MEPKEKKSGRSRRTLYIAISEEVRVAARQRAIGEGITVSTLVERVLREKLGLKQDQTDGGSDE